MLRGSFLLGKISHSDSQEEKASIMFWTTFHFASTMTKTRKYCQHVWTQIWAMISVSNSVWATGEIYLPPYFLMLWNWHFRKKNCDKTPDWEENTFDCHNFPDFHRSHIESRAPVLDNAHNNSVRRTLPKPKSKLLNLTKNSQFEKLSLVLF